MKYICYMASMKDVQATGEPNSTQKRTSSTSKQCISSLFFCVSFFPIGIRIRCSQSTSMRIHAEPVPDPKTLIVSIEDGSEPLLIFINCCRRPKIKSN